MDTELNLLSEVEKSRASLTGEQHAILETWMPGHVVVEDMGWHGRLSATVLRVRHASEEFVVKAGRPDNHHIDREITAYTSWRNLLSEGGTTPRLVQADIEHKLLVLTYLDGVLVEGHEAEWHATTYEQAGRWIARLHRGGSREDRTYWERLQERAVQLLDGEHAIEPEVESAIRTILDGIEVEPAQLVPTHGDWQPRNWLVNGDEIKVIDLGRADWRPAISDLVRLFAQQFREQPALANSFFDGYAGDPREPAAWRFTRLYEGIATACWARRVGDPTFEAQGHRMISEVLAKPEGGLP